jgi:hypothetical protein
MQSDERYQAKQHNTDLVDANAGVIDRIKGFDRKLEPAAVQGVKPVVGKNVKAEPNDQQRVVNQGRPDKKVQDLMIYHLELSPIGDVIAPNRQSFKVRHPEP